MCRLGNTLPPSLPLVVTTFTSNPIKRVDNYWQNERFDQKMAKPKNWGIFVEGTLVYLQVDRSSLRGARCGIAIVITCVLNVIVRSYTPHHLI